VNNLGLFYYIKMRNHVTVLVVFILLTNIYSCKKKEEKVIKQIEFQEFKYSIENLNFANEFQLDSEDTLKNNLLVEASGLAVSSSNSNFFWSHNDSGWPNWLFPVSKDGEDFGYVSLTGAGARDWEDICIGPGPQEGMNYLYIGDIGDNHQQYNYVIIYRIPEPDLSNFNTTSSLTFDEGDLTRFEFEYPDGVVNAESLMIDPWTKNLYIISKSGFRSIIYEAKAPFDNTNRTKLKKIAQFPFTGAVAADISRDGKHIAIKTLSKIYYWNRNEGESLLQTFAKQPRLLPYIQEPQGESFGWTTDACGYFTLSEKKNNQQPIIYYYKKP
jgi:hypothetical protein